MAILQKRKAEETAHPHSFILNGTTNEDLMALTLWCRIPVMIIAILEAMSEVMSLNLEEITENILNNETTAKKCAVMLNALQEYNRTA